jgi:hypothetical protein
MKTREQAEARALKLYPNTHIATVNQLHEVSRDAFLQCFDEMQVPMNLQEVKERALELFPIHEEFDVDRLKPLREAYLQGWEEAQQNKQTCGFCVELKEVEMIECPDCNGEGTWYNDTSRQCTTYRGDCCGGCGYDVDCDTCNGTGEIEREEE